jgi:Uma2 family endonuclease
MSVMTLTRAGRADRPMTVEDLDLLPDDGNRYEIDDGVLVVSPAPSISHQVVLQRLAVLLDRSCPPEFMVVPGPGVEMSRVQYRIPDLVVVRADAVEFTDKSILRPPELAIEVASPSTALYDRNRKKDVYAGFGIPSYWIVTPSAEAPRIVAFELANGAYEQVADVSGKESCKVRRPYPVEIVPADLVAGPWRR